MYEGSHCTPFIIIPTWALSSRHICYFNDVSSGSSFNGICYTDEQVSRQHVYLVGQYSPDSGKESAAMAREYTQSESGNGKENQLRADKSTGSAFCDRNRVLLNFFLHHCPQQAFGLKWVACTIKNMSEN